MRNVKTFLYVWAAVFLVLAAVGRPVSGQSSKKSIILSPVGSYDTPYYDEGAVEISAYDQQTRRAFLTFAELPRIEVVDLSDPTSPFLTHVIDLTPWGADAHATSLAVHNGVVAAAIPQGPEDTGPGKVVFFNAYGTYINEVTVGALPDMVRFTPNGQYVLTADEGQPLDDYSYDPEGSVSIIDMSDGAEALTQAHVTVAGFAAFNAPAVIDPRIRIFGPGASVAEDLEPEYIAVSADSKTAWVTLQENNALAVVDLTRRMITGLVALGFKNHGLPANKLDASDRDGIDIQAWPGLFGMYQPDGIAALQSGGRTFLVTANEGDVRNYDGFDEAERVKDVVLDPTAFPNAAVLQGDDAIGRLNVTTTRGDVDDDGDFDELYAFGARSFTVWSAEGGLIWDSGDAFEQITAARYPANFNASNSSNTPDSRSDDKGPEPEGIAVAKLFGRDYVFVALERIGGVMVYDISDPTSPSFVQYINMRNFSESTNTAAAGDLGPEAFTVIENSSLGSPILLVSNEVSGTLRVFRIAQEK